MVFPERGREKPFEERDLSDEVFMVVDASEECPNFCRRVTSSDHLHLWVSKVEHKFRLRLEIFRHPLSGVCRRGLSCSTHDIPKVHSFQHQCHASLPSEVVWARKLIEVVASHGGWDERGSAMR